MAIRARLVSAGYHGKILNDEAAAFWKAFDNTEIVIGKPLQPVGVACDTDVIWEVLGPSHLIEAVRKYHGTPEGRPVVCRHQIDVGD